MSTKTARTKSRRAQPWGKTVKVEFENGIAWVIFNRPEKRNAFSAELAFEMMDVLDALEGDDRCGVLVFTGAGEAWSAGMIPQLISDRPKVASSAAIARSHATSGVNAPPKHHPFTIAMVGFG